MAFNFENLDQATRDLMLNEVTYDTSKQGGLYLSRRFSNQGRQIYETLLRNAITNGNEETLTASLAKPAYFNETEERNVKGKTVIAKIPSNAAELLAQGEFNRFYIRALCLRAANENRTLQIYRARQSSNPRPESEAMIGQTVNNLQTLLNDLRDNYEVDKVLGLPPGPNSGLSCRLV